MVEPRRDLRPLSLNDAERWLLLQLVVEVGMGVSPWPLPLVPRKGIRSPPTSPCRIRRPIQTSLNIFRLNVISTIPIPVSTLPIFPVFPSISGDSSPFHSLSRLSFIHLSLLYFHPVSLYLYRQSSSNLPASVSSSSQLSIVFSLLYASCCFTEHSPPIRPAISQPA